MAISGFSVIITQILKVALFMFRVIIIYGLGDIHLETVKSSLKVKYAAIFSPRFCIMYTDYAN